MLASKLLQTSTSKLPENLFFQSMSAGVSVGVPSVAYNSVGNNIVSCFAWSNNIYAYAIKVDGSLLWQKVITASNSASNPQITVNSSGIIFVAYNIATTPSSIEVVRLSGGGSYVGSTRLSDSVALPLSTDFTACFISDTSGNVYFTCNISTTTRKAALIKLDSSGGFLWGVQISDTVAIDPQNISIETSGNLLFPVFKTTSGARRFIYRVSPSGSIVAAYGLFITSTGNGRIISSPDGGIFLAGYNDATTSGVIKYSSTFTSPTSIAASSSSDTGMTVDIVGDKIVYSVPNNVITIVKTDLSTLVRKSTSSSTVSHINSRVLNANGSLALSGTAQSTGAYNDAFLSRLDLNNINGNYGSLKFTIANVTTTLTTLTPPSSDTVTSTASSYTPTVSSSSPSVSNSSLTPQLFLKV